MRQSMIAMFMQVNGALTGGRGLVPWARMTCRGADTVGNQLDFRRVGGRGARIASTAVRSPLVRSPEDVNASVRPAR